MKTILLELTEDEAKRVLMAVWIRKGDLKDSSPKHSQMYHDLIRKIEAEGIRI